LDLAAWSTPDPRGDCVAFLRRYEDRLSEVNVDSVGIGYNFGLHLEDEGFPVKLVNVGESPTETDRFANLKAQAYWGLRERFEAGEISGLTDEATISQLAAIRYEPTPRGQIRIESKEELRKRGVKSPDRAEALMLAYLDTTPGILRYYQKLAERGPERAQPKPPRPPGEGANTQDDEDNDLIAEYERARAEYDKLF
jgi:hypothetical protein